MAGKTKWFWWELPWAGPDPRGMWREYWNRICSVDAEKLMMQHILYRGFPDGAARAAQRVNEYLTLVKENMGENFPRTTGRYDYEAELVAQTVLDFVKCIKIVDTDKDKSMGWSYAMWCQGMASTYMIGFHKWLYVRNVDLDEVVKFTKSIDKMKYEHQLREHIRKNSNVAWKYQHTEQKKREYDEITYDEATKILEDLLQKTENKKKREFTEISYDEAEEALAPTRPKQHLNTYNRWANDEFVGKKFKKFWAD